MRRGLLFLAAAEAGHASGPLEVFGLEDEARLVAGWTFWVMMRAARVAAGTEELDNLAFAHLEMFFSKSTVLAVKREGCIDAECSTLGNMSLRLGTACDQGLRR